MEEQQNNVNPEDIVIPQNQDAPTLQVTEEEPQESVASEETTPPQEQESTVEQQSEALPAQGEENQPAVYPVDDDGVPWQNRAMEAQRKLADLQEMVDGAYAKAQDNSNKDKQPEESIEDQIAKYEEFLETNPEHSAWTRKEIKKLERKELRMELESIREEEQRRIVNEQRKKQSEEAVVSNPMYQDAFVENANGQKVLNNSSPLTQRVQQYMSDSRISQDPEGASIAFKLAWADMQMDQVTPQSNKFQNIKRQNAKLKQQTLTEGGGVVKNKPQTSSFGQSMENLRANPSDHAQRSAVKEYIRAKGIIK